MRPGFGAQLARPVSLDTTSVMDAAIVLGTALAAASSGMFRARWGGDVRAWAAALLGGIAMGYGARLANGCNIGAYFSAIAAGSASRSDNVLNNAPHTAERIAADRCADYRHRPGSA